MEYSVIKDIIFFAKVNKLKLN